MRIHALMCHQEDKPDLVPKGDHGTFDCSLCSTRLPLDTGCVEGHLSGHHRPDVGGGLRGYFLSEVYRGPPPPKEDQKEAR